MDLQPLEKTTIPYLRVIDSHWEGIHLKCAGSIFFHSSCCSAEIVFKAGDTEHYVEVEILYDGIREMREAFTLHLKPDENMVAETKVNIWKI